MEKFGPGCPWYDSLQIHGPANLKWCEERVCGWINEPANAWSNAAYFLAAAWIFHKARQENSRGGLFFAFAVFVMGALSFLYHASNNFLTQALDFTGMFLMVFFVIAGNLARMRWLSRRAAFILYLFACVGGTAALWPIHATGLKIQWLVAVAAVVLAASEYGARVAEGETRSLKLFWTCAAVMVASELCSLADGGRFLCDPSSHLVQGHALWHCGGGVGMTLLYAFSSRDFAKW